MRIKKLFTLFSFIITLFFVTSVSAMNQREKMLVGSWKPVKIAPYVQNKHNDPVVKTRKVADTTAGVKKDTGKETIAVKDAKKKADQLQHYMDTQMRTTFTLNADKTCRIQNPSKEIEGKWKLKKKGSSLVIKVPGMTQNGTLELVTLNDTVAMAIQRTNLGDMIIRYRKQ